MPWTGGLCSAPDRQSVTSRQQWFLLIGCFEISADHEGEPHACTSLYESGARAKYGVIVTQYTEQYLSIHRVLEDTSPPKDDLERSFSPANENFFTKHVGGD